MWRFWSWVPFWPRKTFWGIFCVFPRNTRLRHQNSKELGKKSIFRRLRFGNFLENHDFWGLLGHIEERQFGGAHWRYFWHFAQNPSGGIFAQLYLLGCFYNDETCTKMRFSTTFFDFLVILVIREHPFYTTKNDPFRFIVQKGTFLMGSPLLGFQSTPSSYRLVPKIARRDRFKNDKIGPKQWFPRIFFGPIRFSIFRCGGGGTFLAKIPFYLFLVVFCCQNSKSCVKISV